MRGCDRACKRLIWRGWRHDCRTPFTADRACGKAGARDGNFVDFTHIFAILFLVCGEGILSRGGANSNGAWGDGGWYFRGEITRENARKSGEFGICGIAGGGRGVSYLWVKLRRRRSEVVALPQ